MPKPVEYLLVDLIDAINAGQPPRAIAEVWTTGVLVATTSNTQSAWLDVGSYENFYIMKTSAGGTYALEIDWSRDGAAVDIVESVSTSNNEPNVRTVMMKFARLRVRNTDAVAAFSAHRTTVFGR